MILQSEFDYSEKKTEKIGNRCKKNFSLILFLILKFFKGIYTVINYNVVGNYEHSCVN